jgi:hypothetical protein
MKKPKANKFLPVSLRDLAAYLGISGTLLSMTETGRHGVRRLSSRSSKKMSELMLAHQQVQKSGVPGNSLRKCSTA